MRTFVRTMTCVVCLGILLSGSQGRLGAEEEKPAGDAAPKVTYDDHVRAIFREHCFSCHNQDTKKSDLAVDNFAAVMAGGASGEVIEPGDPESSRLWALISHAEEPKMPPEQDRLPDAKLEIVKNWILGGALENAGSVAKMKKQPTVDLSATAGANKPSGPVVMPEGISRQPVVYTTRPGAVTALASSPWAPLVAVAGQKQISLYHSDTGKLLGVLPFPEGIAHVLKFSRSGSLLLAGGGQGGKAGRVAVYDVKTGNRVFEVGDELDAVLAADINENHTLIALGGPSRVVRIFSTADGSLVHEIRKHTEWIYALEFSPDGVLLATADRNGSMFVWEAETAREYQNLSAHKAAVTDVSWRLDSNMLASCSEDGTIKLWEMENGTEVKNWGAHGGGAMSVEFARDGRLVSAGRDRVAKVWDANGGQVRAFEALGDIAMEAIFTHDGARAIAGDWLGDVRMWEVADGKLVSQLPPNPPTLEMVIQAETAAATAAMAAAQQVAAEATAAEAALAEATKAAQAATEMAAALQAEADKLPAEDPGKQAAVEKAAAAKAEADKLVAARQQAEEALAPKAAASKAAAEAAAAAQAALQQTQAEKAALDQMPSPGDSASK